MLYRPEAFEPLTDEPWEEARVRSAIKAIVADADDTLIRTPSGPPTNGTRGSRRRR